MDFSGKAVLVTGSTRGIGHATAALFQAQGARVAINGRSQASLKSAFGNAVDFVPAIGDVSTAAGSGAVVAAALAGLGRLDILVNNAGVYYEKKIEESDETVWDQTLDINLKGTFFVSRAALPALRESRGVIVNLASDASLVGYDSMSVYSASKAGVLGLTKAMAIELAPEVRVNCVCPGWVDTDMSRNSFAATTDPDAARREAEAETPMKRLARPEEVAQAIAYLASSEAGIVTGAALSVDGGNTAGRI